jgi:hypothetical protein
MIQKVEQAEILYFSLVFEIEYPSLAACQVWGPQSSVTLHGCATQSGGTCLVATFWRDVSLLTCYGWVFVFSAKLIQCDGICEYYDYLIEPSLEALCFP